MDPDDLRDRASRYRDIARTTTDARAVKALYELAEEYEAQAAEAEARSEMNEQDIEPPARERGDGLA